MNASPRKSTFTRRPPAEPDPVVPEKKHKHDAAPAKAIQKLVGNRLRNGGTGNPKGRPKGSKNRVPRELRAAVLDAGDLAGYDVVVKHMVEEQLEAFKVEHPEIKQDAVFRRNVERAVRKIAQGGITDYLREQAEKNPTAFLGVLGKVLPKQIDMNVQLTSRQVLDEMSERRDVLADLRSEIVELAKGVDYHAEED